jgi:CheY-like chemotaxis protein
VILQDLVMPEMDGLDLVKLYREQAALKETPLIVLSSKEEAETKAKAFALGANDYLVKLPDPVEVVARLRHHSEGYKALRERNAAFAALAASEKHLQEENRRAADYVRSLLPPPMTEGLATTDWRFVPSESLGGDAFGYHWLDQSRLAVYLLDVCGHGVGPALLGVSAMNVIHSNAIPNRDMGDPAAVLEVNGDPLAAGVASPPIPLGTGTTRVTIQVTGEGGEERTYQISATRLPAVLAFGSPATVPAVASGFSLAGLAVALRLDHAPVPGAALTVLDNTGPEPIAGRFTNLADGQTVQLPYGGVIYPFVADYYGGTGNELVLRWANSRLFAWGGGLGRGRAQLTTP